MHPVPGLLFAIGRKNYMDMGLTLVYLSDKMGNNESTYREDSQNGHSIDRSRGKDH